MRINLYKRPFTPPNVVEYSFFAVKEFIPNGKTKKAMEIGCGLGAFSFRYVSNYKVNNLLGVDVSCKLIDFLSAHYKTYYDNINFLCLDFCQRKLQIKDKYDFVYSSDVLEHVRDVPQFVNNVFEVLQPKGRAVINFPNMRDHGVNHFETTDDLKRVFSMFGHINIYKVEISESFGSRAYFFIRKLFDLISFNRYKKIRRGVYESKKKGTDNFEETSAFEFAKNSVGIKNLIACLLTEILLLTRPRINIQKLHTGDNIIDTPRIVLVAEK